MSVRSEAEAFADELIRIAEATGDKVSAARLRRMKAEFPQVRPVEVQIRALDPDLLRREGAL